MCHRPETKFSPGCSVSGNPAPLATPSAASRDMLPRVGPEAGGMFCKGVAIAANGSDCGRGFAIAAKGSVGIKGEPYVRTSQFRT